MKKTITKADGSVEVIEGSPEEIRRYEDSTTTFTFPSYPDKYTKWYKYVNPYCYACNGQAWFGVVPPVCICGNMNTPKWDHVGDMLKNNFNVKDTSSFDYYVSKGVHGVGHYSGGITGCGGQYKPEAENDK